ncbi:MAG TPA: hypothetical protein VJK04_03410 [Candidatus Paceibacterota bacterium]
MNESSIFIALIVLGVIALAFYLNIGWALGTYFHVYIFGMKPETFWQKMWGGGYTIWNYPPHMNSLRFDQILVSICLPLHLIIIVASWLVYILVYIINRLLRFIIFILWLIFAGGIVKLLKIG